MFIKILTLSILISLLSLIINGQSIEDKFYYGNTEFTIDYLLNSYKVEVLKNNNTVCPYYSSGPREIYKIHNSDNYVKDNSTVTICEVNFACHKDKCLYYKSPYTTFFISNNTQHSIYFTKEDDLKQKLILHSCLKKDEYCNTNSNDVKCKTNADCFSNKCSNGRCIINMENPLKLCRISYGGEENFSIRCGLDINETCVEDKNCDTDYCSSYTKMCFNNKIAYRFAPTHRYLFIFSGFMMLIVLTLILYIYYIKDKFFIRNLHQSDNELSSISTSHNRTNTNNNQNTNDSDSDVSDVVYNNAYYHN